MKLRVPHPSSGGSSQKEAVPRATDPLLLLAYELLDTSITMPLTSLGWTKVAWLDTQGISDAINFCLRNDHQDLARKLKKLRGAMRKSSCDRVADLPLSKIIETARPKS